MGYWQVELRADGDGGGYDLPVMATKPNRRASSRRVREAGVPPVRPFAVEYYYKIKWGHAEEWLRLFRKNHYPVLAKQVEMGRMLEVRMDEPRYHAVEAGRWDYRVTIVFKDGAAATATFDEGALKQQLFPDGVTFQKEEQRRFEILDAHWDVPIKTVDPATPSARRR